jgi:hypothetical protein
VCLFLNNAAEIETYIEDEFDLQNHQYLERMDMDGPLEESRKVSMLAVDIKVLCLFYLNRKLFKDLAGSGNILEKLVL